MSPAKRGEEYTTCDYDSTDSEMSRCVGGVAKQRLRQIIYIFYYALISANYFIFNLLNIHINFIFITIICCKFCTLANAGQPQCSRTSAYEKAIYKVMDLPEGLRAGHFT